MIKLPDSPVVRGVATLTLRAQSLFVEIIVAVATAAGGSFVLGVLMALFAGRCGMHAIKREMCQVMIKTQFFYPASRIVALVAVLPLFPFMYVVCLVA